MFRLLSLFLLSIASGVQSFQSPIKFGDLYAENQFQSLTDKAGISVQEAASASFFDGQTEPSGDQYFKAMFAGGIDLNNGSIRVSNQIKVFDPKTKLWYTEKPLSVARFGITSAVTTEAYQRNKVIFAGGLTTSTSTNDMLIASGAADIYSANTGMWKSYPYALSVPRFGMSSIVLAWGSGETLFVGGFEGSMPFKGATGASAVIEAYNPATDSWSKKSLVLKGGARGNMAVGRCSTAILDPLFVFFGGSGSSDGKDPSNAVDIYNEILGTWLTSSVSVARSLVGVASASSSRFSSVVIFAGGFTGSASVVNIDIFLASNKNSLGIWRSTVLPEPMSGLVGATFGSIAIFAGGCKRTATSVTPSDSVFMYSNGILTTLKLSAARSQAAVAIASFIESRIGGSSTNYIVITGGQTDNMLPLVDFLVHSDCPECKSSSSGIVKPGVDGSVSDVSRSKQFSIVLSLLSLLVVAFVL